LLARVFNVNITHLLSEELPVPGDSGCPAETTGIEEGEDVDGQEAR